MPAELACQTCIDLTNQTEMLFKRVEDLMFDLRRNLHNGENALDRRSLMFECHAIIEHKQALERTLLDHTYLHGDGNGPAKAAAGVL